MTTYTEKLDDEAVSMKLEQNLSMLVAEKYQQYHLPVPIPYLANSKFKYHDPRAQKYADHLRDGVQLLAKTLDQVQEAQS